jgi:hypothetical protein
MAAKELTTNRASSQFKWIQDCFRRAAETHSKALGGSETV